MNKQHKSKFLIIIIATMLLGICLEAFQTGSSFLYTYTALDTQSEEDTVQASTSHALLSDALFVLEGIRQPRSTASIRQATRRVYIRNTRISFHILALMVVLPLLFVSAIAAAFHNNFQEMLCSLVIIGYIHLSDGKKPARYSYI